MFKASLQAKSRTSKSRQQQHTHRDVDPGHTAIGGQPGADAAGVLQHTYGWAALVSSTVSVQTQNHCVYYCVCIADSDSLRLLKEATWGNCASRSTASSCVVRPLNTATP